MELIVGILMLIIIIFIIVIMRHEKLRDYRIQTQQSSAAF
jgi:hypothetical protein